MPDKYIKPGFFFRPVFREGNGRGILNRVTVDSIKIPRDQLRKLLPDMFVNFIIPRYTQQLFRCPVPVFHCPVLIDRKEGGQYVGRSEFDSSEVDNEIWIDSKLAKLVPGEFAMIKITGASDYDLTGVPI